MIRDLSPSPSFVPLDVALPCFVSIPAHCMLLSSSHHHHYLSFGLIIAVISLSHLLFTLDFIAT